MHFIRIIKEVQMGRVSQKIFMSRDLSHTFAIVQCVENMVHHTHTSTHIGGALGIKAKI